MADGADRNSKIPIKVDPELKELVPQFLSNCRLKAQQIADAVKKNDMQTVCGLGHKLKGTGGTYGFHKMSEIGGRIEQMGAERDLAGIEKEVSELNDYLDRVDPFC